MMMMAEDRVNRITQGQADTGHYSCQMMMMAEGQADRLTRDTTGTLQLPNDDDGRGQRKQDNSEGQADTGHYSCQMMMMAEDSVNRITRRGRLTRDTTAAK